jgi:hypothetical protein
MESVEIVSVKQRNELCLRNDRAGQNNIGTNAILFKMPLHTKTEQKSNSQNK